MSEIAIYEKEPHPLVFPHRPSNQQVGVRDIPDQVAATTDHAGGRTHHSKLSSFPTSETTRAAAARSALAWRTGSVASIVTESGGRIFLTLTRHPAFLYRASQRSAAAFIHLPTFFRSSCPLDSHPNRVRLFFVEEFLPYSWAFLPADASLQCSFRGDSNQASAYPRLSGGQPSLETVPNTVGLSPSGALPSGHSRGVLVRCRGKGGRPAMAVTTGFQGRTFDVPRTCVPCIDLPSRAPCAAADAVFADAKAFLSSSEARQMSESELERELHRRGQDLVRKLLQGHRDQRSPKEAAGPAEDTSGVECSEPREHESHAETTSGTMQVVGLGCARRGHDGLHRLDAALNLLPERYLVEMRRRVTIATASRAPPRTPWKPPWYSTSSTWQRRRGVRCSSPAHRRACRHLVRDPMGVDRPAVTLGCSCGCPQPPRAAGALMRTETSHEAREDQRKSPIGR